MNYSTSFEKHSLKILFVIVLVSGFVLLIMAEYVLSHIENVEYREAVRKGWETLDPLDKELFSQYKNIYSDEKNQPYVFGHKPNVNVKIEKGG